MTLKHLVAIPELTEEEYRLTLAPRGEEEERTADAIVRRRVQMIRRAKEHLAVRRGEESNE